MTEKSGTDPFAFSEPVGAAFEGHDDVFLPEAGLLGGGMVAVFAGMLHEQGEGIRGNLALQAFAVGQIFELQAAGSHGAHSPGADAAGDVGWMTPARGEIELQGEPGIAAEDDRRDFRGRGESVERPTEVGDGEQRLAVEAGDVVAGLESSAIGRGPWNHGGDSGGVVGSEGQTDGGRLGRWVNQTFGDELALFAEGDAEGVVDLVTVDAAGNDLSIPVEERGIFAGQTGDLDGSPVGGQCGLFVGEGLAVGRIGLVQGETAFEEALEAGGGGLLGVGLMIPGTVSPVEGAIAIEEQRGEGQVEIELEPRQIERVGIDQPDPDERVHGPRRLGLIEQDLGIDAGAGEAGNATQDHQ